MSSVTLKRLAACNVVWFCCTTVAVAEQLQGRVVGISDGDTITLLDAEKNQHKIRLEGIDAPEERQAFGTRAREALGKKVHEQNIRVEWSKLDTYGRILGDVFIGDRHINREMVEEGWAWHFKKYSSSPVLATAEVKARNARAGLWSAADPLPPWEFRHSFALADKALEKPPADTHSDTVYVTTTGTKYHRASCRHLKDTTLPLQLDEAKKRYEACKVCKPPQ